MNRAARSTLEAQTIAMLRLIEERVNLPCPTRPEIVEATGVPRREIRRFLQGLADRGLIEIEERGTSPKLRRLRHASGAWTNWTKRDNCKAAQAARWPQGAMA